MEFGATELQRACEEDTYSLCTTPHLAYLKQAVTYAQAYINSTDKDTMNLYDISAISHQELVRRLQSYAVTNGTFPVHATIQSLVDNLESNLKAAIELTEKDPFSLGLDYTQTSDITPHAFGLAVEALAYTDLIHSDPTLGHHRLAIEDAYDLALAQMDWIFGNNAWGSSFVVGAGKTSPNCPQHQVANLNKMPLLGAVIDGPNQKSNFKGLSVPSNAVKCPEKDSDPFKKYTARGVRYEDNVSAWPSSEPADDYSVLQVYVYANLMSRAHSTVDGGSVWP